MQSTAVKAPSTTTEKAPVQRTALKVCRTESDRQSSPPASFGRSPLLSQIAINPPQPPRPPSPPSLPPLLLQCKLTIGAANDPLEHEADSIADRIMRMPAADVIATNLAGHALEFKTAATHSHAASEDNQCEATREGALRRPPARTVPMGEAPRIVHNVLRSQGQPLDPSTRSFFESRFRRDFGQVRIHSDGQAQESARSISSLAYTAGTDIAFANGEYRPSTAAGRRLLGHELVHTIQQTGYLGLATAGCGRKIQRQGALKTIPASQHGPWDDLPSGARNVLQHSFDTRDPSQCGKAGNVEWMWCGASAAESFNQLDKERQSAFRSVYAALVGAGLWAVVDRVVEIHSGNTPGIKALTTSNAGLFELLISNPNFCRDTFLGGKLHPGEVTWRQVVTGAEGLHIGGSAHNRMTAHLDSKAPVAERQADGYCRYAMPHLLPHFSRDVVGLRNLELFPVPTDEPKPGDIQPVIRFRIPGT